MATAILTYRQILSRPSWARPKKVAERDVALKTNIFLKLNNADLLYIREDQREVHVASYLCTSHFRGCRVYVETLLVYKSTYTVHRLSIHCYPPPPRPQHPPLQKSSADHSEPYYDNLLTSCNRIAHDLILKNTCSELRNLVFVSVHSNRDRISPAANFKPTWPKNLCQESSTLLRSIDSQSCCQLRRGAVVTRIYTHRHLAWRVGMALWFRPPVYTRFRYTKLLMFILTSVPDSDPYVLGLLDPHPDPLFRWTDPSINKQKIKKNRDFYCFVTSLWLLTFEEWCKGEEWCKCTFKKE